MQTAVIIINLILSAIGLMCIHLKTYTKEKHIKYTVKQVIIPGAAVGFLCSTIVIVPITILNVLTGILLGILCGEIIYILYLIAKSTWKEQKPILYYDDNTPPKYFITGDKHRNFQYVKDFCREMNTRRKDVLIVLGDTGFNYYEDVRDDKLKKGISDLNITLFCLHGNK